MGVTLDHILLVGKSNTSARKNNPASNSMQVKPGAFQKALTTNNIFDDKKRSKEAPDMANSSGLIPKSVGVYYSYIL
jgi:hypothetical protein